MEEENWIQKFRRENPSPEPEVSIFDVPRRIAELKEILKEGKFEEVQRKNYETALKLYERGLFNGIGPVTLQDGKVVMKIQDLNVRKPYLMEGFGTQLAHREAYPTNFGGSSHHYMMLQMRLISELGGSNGKQITKLVLNDTGSSLQTVFIRDIKEMTNGISQYWGKGEDMTVRTANGLVSRPTVLIEVRLLKCNGEVFSNWIREWGSITPDGDPYSRLSGRGIREQLFFATAPGNHWLYVSETKSGLMSQLPVFEGIRHPYYDTLQPSNIPLNLNF